MSKITNEEIKEGKKQLEGVLILCWVLAVIFGLLFISAWQSGPVDFFQGDIFRGGFSIRSALSLFTRLSAVPFTTFYFLIAPALYIVELVGLYQRKSFAVPLGRAVLVVTMVFLFPVGTIIGAILWKRFNHPASKKYLNYE